MLENSAHNVLTKAVDKRIVAEAGLAGDDASATSAFVGKELVGEGTRGLAGKALAVLSAASRARVSNSDRDLEVDRLRYRTTRIGKGRHGVFVGGGMIGEDRRGRAVSPCRRLFMKVRG